MWQQAKNIYHLLVAVAANAYYGFPAKKLKVIGVTGTDGKTTTANLIYHILKTAGKNVSIISSVNATINGKAYDTGFHVTTPSSWRVQAFLKKATEQVQNTDVYIVLEVTSHAIDQQRIWGIDFAIAVLTNVSNEHLDYHKTYENYLRVKAQLLQKAKVAIINRDDGSYKMISNLNMVTYGMDMNADVNPQTFSFKTKLIGDFNTYNILAAVCVCRELGLSDAIMRKAIASFTLPVGRAEVVYNNDFMVMIDFAHTPNAIFQILSSLRSQVKGKIIHVFGSAGKRDVKKRPAMGETSARYADAIIITAEDPRGEDVLSISQEILSGIPENKQQNVSMIPDRQDAINKAVGMGKKGDFVVITGKGHEQSMNFGEGEVAWSEHKAVKRALELYEKN